MKIVTTSAPEGLPVSVTEARDQCSLLDDDTHDDLLLRLIASATGSVEVETGARLVEQTLRLDFDGFPCGALDLGVYPVAAVTGVAYDDASGDEQSLAANTDYWPDIEGKYPSLVPNTSWPATQSAKPGTVRVTVTAGYADNSAIPDDLRHAILLRVAELFANREEAVVGAAVAPTINTVKHLISPHKRLVL